MKQLKEWRVVGHSALCGRTEYVTYYAAMDYRYLLPEVSRSQRKIILRINNVLKRTKEHPYHQDDIIF